MEEFTALRPRVMVPALPARPPAPKPPPARTPRHLWLAAVALLAVLSVLSVPTLIEVSGTHHLPWQASNDIAILPTVTLDPTLTDPGILTPVAQSVAGFLCAALPWARQAQRYMALAYQQMPGPHPYLHNQGAWQGPMTPWAVSLLLAQWLIEQGHVLPGYTGYNWGNSSGLAGFPSVGGVNVVGSPGSFAYAPDAQVGVEIYVTFAREHLYDGVGAAAPDAFAEARALGQSPWDYAHYNPGPYDGYSLVQDLTTYHLTRYDDPTATC